MRYNAGQPAIKIKVSDLLPGDVIEIELDGSIGEIAVKFTKQSGYFVGVVDEGWDIRPFFFNDEVTLVDSRRN